MESLYVFVWAYFEGTQTQVNIFVFTKNYFALAGGRRFWLLIQEKGSMQVSMFIPAQTWRGGNCKAKRGAQWKTNDPRNHYITFHPWPPTNPNTNGDAKVKEDDVKTEEALLSNGHNRDWTMSKCSAQEISNKATNNCPHSKSIHHFDSSYRLDVRHL